MYFHVWFVTKYRKKSLFGAVDKFVKKTFLECAERHGYAILELTTNKDHVHMLMVAKDRVELAGMVRTMKAVSAREVLSIQYSFVETRRHFWARCYGCREIDKEEVMSIRGYIRNQT